MKIESIRTFTGANVYSHEPVVLMRVDFEDLKGKESRRVSNFNRRLIELLPGLSEHCCDAGAPGGFVERIEAGTGFNHIVEHVAQELLALSGIGEPSGKICYNDKRDESKAVIETTSVETARFLLPVAAELVEAVAREKSFSVAEKITEAASLAADTELGSSGRAIVDAAERRSIPWRRESDSDNLIQLGYGRNLRFIRAATTDRTGIIGADLAGNKDTTRRRLGKFSIPVPYGKIVGNEREAVEALESVGAPVAVKPLDGRQGRGASLNLKTAEEVARAFHAARQLSPKVLVEEFFEGGIYRVLVVGGKMVAASERIRCGVIASDDTARDVTDAVHKSVKTLCERAARIIDLDICGVDLVLTDISAPVPKEKGGIVEINAAPDLRIHTHPSEGEPRDVGGAIIEMLYPNRTEARIPIISITGTNGKTTATRMISHVLAGENINVGTTTSTGIFINGEQIARGDTTGPASARIVLGDKSIDAAVLETARGGIVRRGLAYDWSDISVITNIGEDHIGQDGIESVEDLISIKALIAERVRAGGTLILNADDENSMRISERERVKAIDKQIVYFSLDENNPVIKEHARNGGVAYVAIGDAICRINGEGKLSLVQTNEIPATLGGTADFQIANSMAAIAACRAFGVSQEQIVNRLKTFRTDADNPGRNNLYRVGKGFALVDYGHNTDGFAAIGRMVSKWSGKTLTGIIGLPGDRDNRIIEEAAQIAAGCFDRVIVTEEVNRRGRALGEMAELLCKAIERQKPGKNCEIVFDEIEAFSKAIAEIKKNEVVIIFYRQLDLILKILAQNDAVPIYSFEENTSLRTETTYALNRNGTQN